MRLAGADWRLPRRTRSRGEARKCVSWRPWSTTGFAYEYIDRRTNKRQQRIQRNLSSAATQLLTRMQRSQERWHKSDSVFVKPENVRLEAQLRASRFKVQKGAIRPDHTNHRPFSTISLMS